MSESNVLVSENSEKFIQAVKIGDLKKAKLIFDSSYLTIHDKFGFAAIHWVCLNNYINILKWLLKRKCPIETKAKSGWRPIHMACLKGHKEIIQMLIKSNCNIECETDDGQTPLDIVNQKDKISFMYNDGADEKNRKIVDAMKLKCEGGCDHRFCSLSLSHMTFKKDELIGSAEFAKVYRLNVSQSERIFAVKVIQINTNEIINRETKYIEENINVYREFMSHDNVIKYYGVIRSKDHFYLFMEYMDKGSLKDEIERNGLFPIDTIGTISKQILQALIFLHRNKIIHRNIKTTNILLDSNGKVKLTDFGSSGLLRTISHQYAKIAGSTQADAFCGTAQYMSPELMRSEPYHFGSDIWSMGATVIEMLTGHPPYHDLDPAVVINKIGKAEIVDFDQLPRMTNDLKLFLEKMFQKPTDDRASATELMNSTFIKNVKASKEKQLVRPVLSTIHKKDQDDLQEQCIEIVRNAINNRKIGLSMGLKCKGGCHHKFCLQSFSTNNFPKEDIVTQGVRRIIYKLVDNENYHKFAMKLVMYPTDSGVTDDMNTLTEEISRFRDNIKHDRLIQYYGAIRKKHNILIFMDYIPKGSIKQLLKDNPNNSLSESSIIKYSIQILEGLQYLHNKGMIHSNLKTANILLTNEEDVKLTDYGVRQLLKGLLHKNNKMEFNYTSPEIINDEKYGFPTDIWSLGATIVEMLTGNPPYHDLDPVEVVKKIGVEKQIRFQIPSGSSGQIEKFISKMLKDDPIKRAGISELLQFCSSINWNEPEPQT